MKDTTRTPSIYVLMGTTGDLVTKKIIPALWHLFERGLLSDEVKIIGFSRSAMSDMQFHEYIRKALKKRGGVGASEDVIAHFLRFFSHCAGSFDDTESFERLAEKIELMEKKWKRSANKLFYLAVSPKSYEDIFRNIAAVKLNIHRGGAFGWSKILIEKPFGFDLNSFKEMQGLLDRYFTEEQIYRIDHYFFKEIIQGIENFRFSNNLFEDAWDHTMIDSIHVRLFESIGVGDRGSIYDRMGALRDVGQNHILALLSALMMNYPQRISVKNIRKKRAKLLNNLLRWTDDSVKKNTYRAQFEGYRDIEGVSPNSQTETYFALKTEVNNMRWSGIPITIEAGKRLDRACKEIIITLKHPKNCLLCERGAHKPNKIVFRLEPTDEIMIHFWTKKPGFEKVLEERTFPFFLYERETKVQFVEEYAKIFHAATEGDQLLFLSAAEVAAQWKFVDPIEDAWRRNVVPLDRYEQEVAPVPELFKTVSEDYAFDAGGEFPREINIIGLGKMGEGLARQLLAKNWNVSGYSISKSETKKLEKEGLRGTRSLKELVDTFLPPRLIWIMVPHYAVDDVLDELVPLLDTGDVIIDGGNSPYKESARRGEDLAKKNIAFLDVGVSGGPGGARHGVSVMVGGDRKVYEKYELLFRDIAVKRGHGYMGKSGAGHFVKMIHNGIEYGMMQSIGEGFELMKRSSFDLNLYKVARIYHHGSIISSRLVRWLISAYEKFGEDLDEKECCSGSVGYSGDEQWAIDAARELNVPLETIEGAFNFRKRSQEHPSYTGQVISALRHEFGRHDASQKISDNTKK